MRTLVSLAATIALLAGCARSTRGARGPGAFEPVASGFDHPVWAGSPPGDARLFVVEQPGRIRIVENGRVLPEPFLDLTDRVRDGGERGLLSVAFHPDYAHNGLLFVNYTDKRGDTNVVRFHVSSDPDRADRGSARPILFVEQPYANHNGGLVMFGPDGMLWIGMGDGGSAGDPHGNGQNPHVLLAKMLRIDVNHGDPYAIPRDNPYADGRAGRPEIWAIGLRNPWRFSFDRPSGLLVIADVGQNAWEEVDAVSARAAGLDFGWRLMEGRHCYRPAECDPTGLTQPVLEYGHDQGCSITGGFVYRGRRHPELQGRYFFADYCQGWVRSAIVSAGGARDVRAFGDVGGQVTSFGEDGAGELLVVVYDGRILRIGGAR